MEAWGETHPSRRAYLHGAADASTSAVTTWTAARKLSVSINHSASLQRRVISLFSLFLSSPPFSFHISRRRSPSHYFCLWALLRCNGFIEKLVLSLCADFDGVSGTDVTVNNRKLGFKMRHRGIWCMVGKRRRSSREGWQRFMSKWRRRGRTCSVEVVTSWRVSSPSALCAFRNERSTSGPQISCLKVGKMPIFIKTVVLRCFFFFQTSQRWHLCYLQSIQTR